MLPLVTVPEEGSDHLCRWCVPHGGDSGAGSDEGTVHDAFVQELVDGRFRYRCDVAGPNVSDFTSHRPLSKHSQNVSTNRLQMPY